MILENCVMAPVIDAERSPIVLPVRDEQTAERIGDATHTTQPATVKVPP